MIIYQNDQDFTPTIEDDNNDIKKNIVSEKSNYKNAHKAYSSLTASISILEVEV